MERLAQQVQAAQKVLQTPDADWSDCVAVTEDVAVAVERLGRAESKKEAVRLLMGVSITSIRSKLVKEVCENLVRVLKVTERDFQDLANALLPQVVNTAKNTSSAIRQPGAKLLRKISELVRYDLSLLRKIFVQNTHDRVRTLLLEQLMIIFVYWSEYEVEVWDSDVLEIIRRGLEDQNDKVRKVARETLTSFTIQWSDRVDELMDMPSNQSKMLLVREHRDSPLAAALLLKYPDLANKAEALSRSRNAFARQRSSYQKSPRRNSSQSIEIHVATPPAKQRDQLDKKSRKIFSRGTDDLGAASPESVQDGGKSISRRLFEETNGSVVDQQERREAFDGSQMHGYPSKPTKQKSLITAVHDSEFPSQPPESPRRISLPRSRSASNAEEAALRHPDIRRLQETKIPSPSTRSPILQGKHFEHIEIASTGSNSPNLTAKQASLLPRPSSFTLKHRGSAISTSAAIDEVDEDKADPASSRSSGDYFSKPIPSTMTAIPTPPPPPTDNVTFRQRRRTYIQQEQEDAPPETLSPAVQAAIELTRPSYINTTVEAAIVDDSLEEEAVSPHERQNYDYTSDEADDRDLPEEESGQVAWGHEWGAHQLDNSELQRDDGGNSGVYGDNRMTHDGDTNVEWDPDDNHEFDDAQDDSDANVASERDPDYYHELDHAEDDSDVNVASERDPDYNHELDHAEDDSDAKVTSEWNPNCSHELDHAGEGDIESPDNSTGFVGEVEDPDPENMADKLRVSEDSRAQHVEYSPNDDALMLPEFDDDEAKEEENLKVLKSGNNKGALEGLLDVRNQMARLRAATRKEEPTFGFPVKDRNVPTASAESQLRSPVNDDSPAEASYFERLTLADRSERGPQEGKEASIKLAQVEPKESADEQDEWPSPARVVERATPHEDVDIQDVHKQDRFDVVKALPSLQNDSPLLEIETEYMHAVHADEHPPESSRPQDQAARFETAEKIIAATQYPEPPTQHYYARPQSPEPERYLDVGPRHQRIPPTQMGPKLNPALANGDAQSTTIKEGKKDMAPEMSSPQSPIDYAPKMCDPVPGCVESSPALASVSNTADLRASDPAPTWSPRATSSAKLGWVSSLGITIIVFLAALFCVTGILQAAKKVRDSHEYHLALKARIDRFEASIAESHEKVHKLQEDYVIWNEYVRKLAEEDETNALTQLETIQMEVQKWQQEMKADLLEFRQALSLDSIENALTALRVNTTQQIKKLNQRNDQVATLKRTYDVNKDSNDHVAVHLFIHTSVTHVHSFASEHPVRIEVSTVGSGS